MTWTMIRGDAYDLARCVKADALVSDPPYGRNYKPSRTGTATRVTKGMRTINRLWDQIEGEDRPFDPTPFLNFSIVCLWGANHYASKLPDMPGWFYWDKRVGMPSNDQSDGELAWTNRDRALRAYQQMWNGLIRAGEENIGKSGDKLHPHQKPVALMMWCLDQLGIKPGMTVFDPFAGSGTTGVACLRMGINFVGIEKNKHYCSVAHKRLSAESLQETMFTMIDQKAT